MISVSDEIGMALMSNIQPRTEFLDMDIYPDLIAGQSVINLHGRRYGVLRYERIGFMAKAAVIPLGDGPADNIKYLGKTENGERYAP